MGLFSDIGDALGDVAGGVVDAVSGVFGGITGQTGADASRDAARIQAESFEKYLELLRPTIEAGQRQFEPLEASATIEGFGANIGSILQGGALQPLVQERQRAADALMAARGLRRSGSAVRAAADIPGDLALQIESELNRRRQSIAQAGQTGIQQAGQAQIGIGKALAGGTLGAAQSRSQGIGNILSIGGALLGAFSDESLKKDVEKIGELSGLDVVKWVWNEAGNAMGLVGESLGFIAQDVQKKYPQHVSNVDGLLVINYPALLEEV